MPLSPPALRIVDSITELRPIDAGCLAVSGSHGGMSSARYALAARPLLSEWRAEQVDGEWRLVVSLREQ